MLLDEELSQTAREEKTLKIKFNNERAILTEYFKLVDAYDESVGKKNKAIVELSEYGIIILVGIELVVLLQTPSSCRSVTDSNGGSIDNFNLVKRFFNLNTISDYKAGLLQL